MGKKSKEDREVEARIRAHLRQQMTERGITIAELARRIHTNDGNVNRILKGGRGLGLGIALRICRGLKITGTRLLEEDPPSKFSDDEWGDNEPH
jgi:transcriptional regulator with XRE-family HTH domain